MADSEEEEENYWPGYVDALSTMTMVLTFVMMILVVIVFQLIQNTSKSVLQEIIEQSNIGSASGTNDARQMAKIIVDAITTAQQKGTPPTATSEEEEKQKTKVQSIAIEEPEEVKSEEKAEVTEVGNEVAVTVSQSALVLDFQPKASRLNDEAIERVTAFSQTSELAQGNRVIEVVGFAGVGAGNVSDARRTAYYRAMVVRSEMVKAGIDPARINIAVRDTTEESEGSKVRVFGR
jgi:hypothetical protein